MATNDVWPTVFAERKALAADLENLPADSWDKMSLSSQWTVRDALAHMTATAKITPPLFFAKMLGNGFSLTKLQAKDIAVERGSSPGDTLARFKAITESTKRPPGPIDTMLGETIVHSEDIRRPLGIRHDYPPQALMRVADFFKGSNLIIGTRRRIEGLSLRASDVTWSHGSGPEVSGPMLSLLMAMTGRKAAVDDLAGEGVTTLCARP
jgi:uncharacterized protein (TIGR03083 family)